MKEIQNHNSSEDEIDAVKQNLGKCQTPISLVIDKGTGVGQARAKGLAAVKNEAQAKTYESWLTQGKMLIVDWG